MGGDTSMSEVVTMTVPFGDVLRLGSKGTQPVAVKRGLYRAGFKEGWPALDSDAIHQEILGATAITNLKKFQTYHGLPVDGVYNEADHKALRGSFDAYAEWLYRGGGEPPDDVLQLPATFKPTHDTAGLDGYPAIDVFGAPGMAVAAPAAGVVSRLSGHDPAQGGVPGGAYGWSIYLGPYYLTHFGSRAVGLGQTVRRGDILGTICDAKVSGKPSSSSHIHEGKAEL
jgi:murein DD-endopeptidase MepM/ murein hydrolase activator NlpD